MKNLIKLIILFSCIILWLFLITANNTYAADKEITLKVETTEEVPWGNCTAIKWSDTAKKNPTLYQCEIKKWFNSVMEVLNKMIKYWTLIAALTWVLFIVINWIAISASGVDSWAKEAAKWRIIQTILWLILLLLTGTILSIIAPWVYY